MMAADGSEKSLEEMGVPVGQQQFGYEDHREIYKLGRCGPRRLQRSARGSVFYTKYGRRGGSKLGCCPPLAVRPLTGTPQLFAAG